MGGCIYGAAAGLEPWEGLVGFFEGGRLSLGGGRADAGAGNRVRLGMGVRLKLGAEERAREEEEGVVCEEALEERAASSRMLSTSSSSEFMSPGSVEGEWSCG